ncbi:MAG: malectin domain-containing carbohydrate-binding protein [Planctomycetota bacterium]
MARIAWLAGWRAALVVMMSMGCRNLGLGKGDGETVIVSPPGASALERLAAKEVRRYAYLRTGELLKIVEAVPASGRAVLVAARPAPGIGEEEWSIETEERGGCRVTVVSGGGSVGTLYAAYRLAEKMGVRFYPHGDVVPDAQISLAAALDGADDLGRPLFALRGLHPFHDFPEGPDWWDADAYAAVLAQMAKMGMNFFGLHTYPEGGVGPEPTVWIGPSEELGEGGRIQASYPSRHFTTHTGGWGYAPKDTGDYLFGARELFAADDHGAPYMRGRAPLPPNAAQCDQLFEDFGDLLHEVFGFARRLGIKTCLGTETPLTIPTSTKNRLIAAGKDPNDPAVVRDVYEAMFRRIAARHPLDYYWLWTPEGWTWSGVGQEEIDRTIADLWIAGEALSALGAPFALATCGWVLGPPSDRALFDAALPKDVALSCINRNVGFAAVDPGFAAIEGRATWAIPWLEDDPALIIPQLWVGRTRRDAADALAYGCTGLMGIHWRTRTLAPNMAALAQAAWEQRGWNREAGARYVPEPAEAADGALGGNVAAFPDHAIAGTDEDPVYRTVRWNADGYRLNVPPGTYAVRLMFCEPHYGEAGRRVFGVKLQGEPVIAELDIFARVGQDRALDFTFPAVAVTSGPLSIEFTREVEYPCIAGIVVEGAGATRRINCGGPAWGGYEADLGQPEYSAGLRGRTRDLPAADLYADWANAEFGPEVGDELALLFTRLDGVPAEVRDGSQASRLPRPSTWVGGPGGLQPDPRPWSEVAPQYAFVEEMAALGPRIRGAGARARFDWWLETFRYLRAVGRTCGTWARFDAAMNEARAGADPAAKARLARELALPIRIELVADVAKVHRHLLATVSTPGGLGTVANWQQHLLPGLLEKPGEELAALLRTPLPPSALPAAAYEGPPRLFVPVARTVLESPERGGATPPALTVIVLGAEPAEADLRWRPLGEGEYEAKPLERVARGVWRVELPPAALFRDLEYHVRVATADRQILVWPPTAPAQNQTTVVLDPE